MKKEHGMRWLSAASLAVSLAMFGCTSNQWNAEGQATRVTPAIQSVNPSTTYGSYPPMASSYSSQAAPHVNTDALAVVAADRGFRGYVLGPVNPDGAQQGVTVANGQFESPANSALPQATVNSSINSQPVPAITNGDVVVANSSTAAAASPVLMNSTPVPQASGTTGQTLAQTSALRTATGIQLQTTKNGGIVMTNVSAPAVKGK